ncbi:MAG: D-tyrosyl-tRNA(Tyr) deacylase [Thermogemmatispora sp.]|uniref:D-aminoacyl-tRNA deacylase n=1 Tax=Thermogemmatispora sp. TaxID=1968838 RepID=UPI0019D8248D|nr:D-aminoacyl-tRNA deacylase [Thermogemmatispora sp.]MBE3566681.1 D-tyrosyl-tRNA(Tyr) deacylase [Thermogemmatispora sp.]
MRALLQRVSYARVRVANEVVAEIGPGLLVLLGVAQGDGEAEAKILAEKIVHLRIFEDEAGKMNRSLLECGGEMLVVSQFTLYADARKGRRPSFTEAAPPAQAEPLIHSLQELVRSYGVRVSSGVFGAHMVVELANDGQVTIWLDSADLPRR